MSFHVRVFEHGEWIDRVVDINHFMSRNRIEPKRLVNQRIPVPAKSPTVGFLSRTVYRSPLIRWVLPANIRYISERIIDDSVSNEGHETDPSNDIVFVGDDFIHLKQIDPETGQLSHLGTEAGFNSRIRAAKTFGEPKQRKSGPKLPNNDRIFIKSGSDDENNYEGDTRSNDFGRPAQLLILTMESQELLFITAYESSQGRIKFQRSAVPLPNPKSLLSKPGKHLAIDPRSRAFAVGASAGLLVIYNAKSKKQMRDEFTSHIFHRHPILSDKIVMVEGMILKMEFLCPSPNDKDNIILVLVTSKDERGWLQCFEWDSLSGFQNFRCHQKQPLMTFERMPLMLVPFSKSPKFLLVTEHKLTVVGNVLTGSLSRKLIKLPCCIEPPDHTTSQKSLLLTSWARPAGNSSGSHECLYLGREDGIVYYLQISDRSVDNKIKTGNLKTRIGTAFANLNTCPTSPDIFISVGDLCNGGLFSIGYWPIEIKQEDIPEFSPDSAAVILQKELENSRTGVVTLQRTESIHNWSPIFDFVCNLNRDSLDRSRCSIFITSGCAPHGAITELRYGYQAKIGGYFLEQPELSSSTGLWSIEHKSTRGVYLILAMPLQTSLLHVSTDLSSVEVDFDEHNCGLDFANETIVAQDLPANDYVQITRKTIVLLDLESKGKIFERKFHEQLHPESTISAALVKRDSGLIVTAIRTDDVYTLNLHKFTGSNDQIQLDRIGQALNVRQECICIASFGIRNNQYICVGTAAATIEIYRIDHQTGLVPVLKHNVMPLSSVESQMNGLDAIPKICESIVVLYCPYVEYNRPQDNPVIVCGLRNGYIYCVELDLEVSQDMAEQGALTEGRKYTMAIGFTSVKLTVDTAKPNTAAFVMCGSDTLYLTHRRSGEQGFSLSYIWFTDLNELSYQQDVIPALTRFRAKDLPNALVCSSGSSFLLCELSKRKQSVPRRIPVESSPNRLLYIAHLKAMAVASLPSVPKSTERTGVLKQKDDKPILSGLLQFISLDKAKDSPHKDHVLGVYKCLNSKERIYALTEWNYEDDTGKKYYFIVLGTSIPTKNSSGAKGRVYLLRPWLYQEGEIKIMTHKVWDFREGPVYAIAFQGVNCMLITAGKSLLRFQYSSSANRWEKLQGTQLTSPGVRIAVRGPYAHVATSLDSLQSFTFESASTLDSCTPTYTELGRVCSDGQARSSASVLPITFSTLSTLLRGSSSALHTNLFASSPGLDSNFLEAVEIILLSDKAGSIVGLHFAPDKRIANAAPLLFEATFSRSITVLRRGKVRSPWRRPHFNIGNHDENEPRQMHRSAQARNNDQRQKTQGVLVDDIIGSATDGTIIAGTVIDEHAWRLSSFLTRACQPLSQFSSRHFANENVTQLSSFTKGAHHGSNTGMRAGDTNTQYFKSGSHPLEISIDPDDDVAGLRRKLAYHIDGDVLASILERAEEEESREDPAQTLIDAINGLVRSDGHCAATYSQSKGRFENAQGTRHAGSTDYKWKKEHKERVRKLRTARWQLFDKLAREVLPREIREVEIGISGNDDRFKNGTHDKVIINTGRRKEEDVKGVVDSRRPNDHDGDDDDNEFDDGTMEIEEAQFEMDARWQGGGERHSNEGEEEDDDEVEEDEEEKAQVRERKKVMGVVVDWLRALLLHFD